jgi:hypothetical protein
MSPTRLVAMILYPCDNYEQGGAICVCVCGVCMHLCALTKELGKTKGVTRNKPDN